MTSRLFFIPIIHTPKDLGSLLPEARKEFLARFGAEGWNNHVRDVNRLWSDIRRELSTLSIDFDGLKIFQDGLPECGQEMQIVRSLAADGSVNHQILLELVNRGGTIVGTEDPRLLIEELNRAKEAARRTRGHTSNLTSQPSQPQPTQSSPPSTSPTSTATAASDVAPVYDDLLDRRDRFIAEKITSALKEGEVGILFIGALHRVVEKLPESVIVHRLPDSSRGQ